MKRYPSLHLHYKDFIKVIDEVKELTGRDYSRDLNLIFRKAKKYSLSSRNVMVTNDKLQRNIQKLTRSSQGDASLFSNLFYTIRRKKKHRGISLITPTHKDWVTIKDITKNAVDFCEEFELNNRKGFIEYISIGLSMMKKFSLYKFKGLNESIYETFSAIQELQSDPSYDLTQKVYEEYSRISLEKSGISIKYDRENNPSTFIYFKKMKDISKDLGLDPVMYVKAQFEGLEWYPGIPSPVMMVGDKAIERLRSFVSHHNLNKKSDSPKVNWSKIKKV